MHLVILSALAMRYVDYPALKKEGVKLFLLMDLTEEKFLSPELKAHFESIDVLACGPQEGSVPALNVEKTYPVIQKLLASNPGVTWRLATLNEYNVLLVARLNKLLGLPGPSEEALLPYHDKSAMKQKLVHAGIRVPHHVMIHKAHAKERPESYFQELTHVLKLPFIIKPTHSAGSHGVSKIEDFSQFASWVKTLETQAHWTFEAEEFITGMLYHCDTAVEAGKVLFSQCCEYTYPNMEICYQRIIGSRVLSKSEPLPQQLLAFSEKVLQALGLLNIMSHMELFVTPSGEIIFLEIGPRPPGATSALMYRHDFDVSIANLYFRVLLGIPYAFTPDVKGYSFWAFLPHRAGKVKALVPPPISSTYTLEWLVKVGDILQDSQSVVDISGKLFAYHDQYEVLKQDFNRLRDYQPLEVEAVV